ncbi:MAG: hypothetical protein ACOCWM_01845 [Cyclobacteriaceae bacterium]
MKKSMTILFLLLCTFSFANSPQLSCNVELLLSTKVYAESDFRAESITYLKKGSEVELLGYHKGFYTIIVNDTKAYITEANIKYNQDFEKFKNYIFSLESDGNKLIKKSIEYARPDAEVFANN